jgi:8-oxo-dGTP pyrophosphatase MutT (NUDIX family)
VPEYLQIRIDVAMPAQADGDTRMAPQDAAAAFITVGDDGYLMQLRDNRPGIFCPGQWGLFGGAQDAGEGPAEALARELGEELHLHVAPDDLTFCFAFGVSFRDHPVCQRAFYEIALDPGRLHGLTLTEGQDMRVLSRTELFAPDTKLCSYDAYALLTHSRRIR